jgi:hypothetical protein
MVKIFAVLCSLSSPANCHEQTVTTSDFADISMQSCLVGAPQLAEWMKQHPAERLTACFTRTVLVVAYQFCLSGQTTLQSAWRPALRHLRMIFGRSFSSRGQAAPFAGPYRQRRWIGWAWGAIWIGEVPIIEHNRTEFLLYDL